MEKSVLPRGSVLKLTGLPSETIGVSIKNAFYDSTALVAFVDINQDNSAYVLLDGVSDAKAVLAELKTGKVTVGDTLVDVAAPDGEEEDAYLKKAQKYLNNKAANFKENLGGGRVQRRAKTRGGFNRRITARGGSGQNNGTKPEGEEEPEGEKIVLPRGTLLKLTGLPLRTDRGKIKNAFGKSSPDIDFIEVNNDSSAYVRICGGIDAKALLRKLGEKGKMTVGDTLVDVAVVRGKEDPQSSQKRAASPIRETDRVKRAKLPD